MIGVQNGSLGDANEHEQEICSVGPYVFRSQMRIQPACCFWGSIIFPGGKSELYVQQKRWFVASHVLLTAYWIVAVWLVFIFVRIMSDLR